MERNWVSCVLGDIVFIPYGPKGSKTYITAKKVVEANIPAFTLDHPTSADLHKLGIPGFNRNTVKKFFEEHGAKLGVIENRQGSSKQKYDTPEYKSTMVEESSQTVLNFKKNSR
jgi:hypothetical protein